ncbi:MAG: helix-hairpin-helix domain-containing protein [Oscillospiraceae bacterium]|nr:helix-hairpin-helix domain-containing protein [Oscillospiraceae bacterium]
MADKKLKRICKKYGLFFTSVFAVLISVGICAYSEFSDNSEPAVPVMVEYEEEKSDYLIVSPETRTPVNEVMIDINKAEADDLTQLDGIGSEIAEKIVAYRSENGDFSSVDGLLEVSGIGNGKLDNIRPYVYVSDDVSGSVSTETAFSEHSDVHVSSVISTETQAVVSETLLEAETTVITAAEVLYIDINSAGIEELMLLDGIGEATAEKIISYRTEHNGFSSKEEIMNVKGIGEKKYAAIEDFIYVSGVQVTSAAESEKISVGKININTADKDELMSLDGIGDTLADRIISYRTENGAFKSVQDIMNVKGIGEGKFNAIHDYICT